MQVGALFRALVSGRFLRHCLGALATGFGAPGLRCFSLISSSKTGQPLEESRFDSEKLRLSFLSLCPFSVDGICLNCSCPTPWLLSHGGDYHPVLGLE